MIRVEALNTYYGTRLILEDVSLDVMPGEILVILGGSGSGKSTLMRHMVGLLKPHSGRIWLDGDEITSMDEWELVGVRKKIGLAFQGGALFNSMTVGDNVALPLREHTDLEESTIRIMTRMKLDQVGLSGFEDFMPSELSGGMKKRAAVARAMAMDPKILFFDEPSAGLDPIVAAGLDEMISGLNRALGVTMAVVTHEMESAFLIAHRMVLIHKGSLIASGTPDEVRASDHPRVRQFLERRPDTDVRDEAEQLRVLLGEE